MNNKEMINYAKKLRAEAAEIELIAKRPLPKKWKVGQKVRFIADMDHCCSKGCIAKVTGLYDEDKNIPADHYQVFYTSPIGGNGEWWTTPDKVELVPT